MLIVRPFLMVAVLFSACVAGAASNPPAPAARQSSRQEQKQPAEQKKETDSDKRGTKDAPLVVEMITARNGEETTTQQAAYDHEKTFNEKLIAYGTVGLAIITAFLAWFTFRLWKATGKLVLGAESTAERQLRAYLLNNNDEVMEHNGGRVKVTVRIKNFGQTPAHKMRSWLFVGFYKFPLDVPLDQPDYVKGSLSPLGPTAIITQSVELPAPLNHTEIKAILKGEGAIYVSGELFYSDVFDIGRFTKFRYVSTGSDFEHCKLVICNEGNEAT